MTATANALNGNPGWVTVSGQVTSGGMGITGKTVNIKLFKWEGNKWVLKSEPSTTLTNGKYELVNWNGVGVGSWLAKAVFPAQGPFGEGASNEAKEGSFTVKDGYRLVNKASGKCLDVTGASKENTASIEQWECGNPITSQNQVFTMVPQGAYVQLLARHSGRCVDVTGAGAADGVPLQQYTCGGQANQLWQVVDVGGGYFELRAKHSNKCMDLPGASNANGTVIQQWGCNGLAQQKWQVQSVDSAAIPTATDVFAPDGERLNGQPGYATAYGWVHSGAYGLGGNTLKVNYFHQNGAGQYEYVKARNPTINGEGRYEVKYEGLAAGNWIIQAVFPGVGDFAASYSEVAIHLGTGYRIVFRHSNKCLNLYANLPYNQTPIIQWECLPNPNPGDGETFTLVPFENGNYFEILINSVSTPQSGRCVDVTGAGTGNGVRLQSYECWNGALPNQLWQVVPIAAGSVESIHLQELRQVHGCRRGRPIQRRLRPAVGLHLGGPAAVEVPGDRVGGLLG